MNRYYVWVTTRYDIIADTEEDARDEAAKSAIAGVKGEFIETAACELLETMTNWLDKHSVNCASCGELVDERTTVRLEGGGEICEHCHEKVRE